MFRSIVVISLIWVAQASSAFCQFHSAKVEHGYDIYFGKQRIAEYRFQDPQIPRPYFSNLHSLHGTRLTRTHPPDPKIDPTDHDRMHPGLWLAFGDLNGVDFWRNKGSIKHIRFLKEPPNAPASTLFFEVEESYQRTDGQEICRGTNQFAFQSTNEKESDCVLLRWTTKLQAGDQPLVFGDQHEMGLGFRMNTKFRVKDGNGRIVGSHGGLNEQGNWGRESTLWDYSGIENERRAGVQIVIPEGNSRPYWAHARDYGFLAVNPTGKPEMPNDNLPSIPFTVPKNESVTFAFHIWLYSLPFSPKLEDGHKPPKFLQPP